MFQELYFRPTKAWSHRPDQCSEHINTTQFCFVQEKQSSDTLRPLCYTNHGKLSTGNWLSSKSSSDSLQKHIPEQGLLLPPHLCFILPAAWTVHWQRKNGSFPLCQLSSAVSCSSKTTISCPEHLSWPTRTKMIPSPLTPLYKAFETLPELLRVWSGAGSWWPARQTAAADTGWMTVVTNN